MDGAVASEPVEVLEKAAVISVSGTDAFVDQRRKARVRLAEPAPVSDAVSNVSELVGRSQVVVVEEVVSEYLRVQGGNAVDLVRSDDRKIGHAHLLVAKDRHVVDLADIAGELLVHLLAETPVYLADDGVDPWHHRFDEIVVPLFERLGEDGVVRIRYRRSYDLPGAVPLVAVVIHEYAHQLGNGQSGVRIVDVDDRLVVEIVQRAVESELVPDYVLAGSGHHEVLLLETQLLSFLDVVGGVEDLRDELCAVVLLRSPREVSAVEKRHVESFGVSR